MTVKGGVASLAWGMLQEVFSSALPQNDFLKVGMTWVGATRPPVTGEGRMQTSRNWRALTYA